jgi:hypothetical protein
MVGLPFSEAAVSVRRFPPRPISPIGPIGPIQVKTTTLTLTPTLFSRLARPACTAKASSGVAAWWKLSQSVRALSQPSTRDVLLESRLVVRESSGGEGGDGDLTRVPIGLASITWALSWQISWRDD